MLNEERKDNGSMSTADAGRKGGETTARERGTEFYKEIGKKGGEAVKSSEARQAEPESETE